MAAGSSGARVLLVEDHPMMVDGVTMRLESIGMEVVGVCDSPTDTRRLYERLTPDLVLCDVGLGRRGTGIEVTEALVRDFPQARVLMYSGYNDSDLVDSAIRAGAVGYVCKNASKSELSELLEAAMSGRTELFDRSTLSEMLGSLRQRQAVLAMEELTPREREVVELMARGQQSTKELARAMSVSPETCRTHISSIMRKFGVNSRGAVVSKAFQMGIVSRAQPAVAATRWSAARRDGVELSA